MTEGVLATGAVFLTDVRRLRVIAAFLPAARRFRVTAAFRAADVPIANSFGLTNPRVWLTMFRLSETDGRKQTSPAKSRGVCHSRTGRRQASYTTDRAHPSIVPITQGSSD